MYWYIYYIIIIIIESNICACFIENNWKFRIKCPNCIYF